MDTIALLLIAILALEVAQTILLAVPYIKRTPAKKAQPRPKATQAKKPTRAIATKPQPKDEVVSLGSDLTDLDDEDFAELDNLK